MSFNFPNSPTQGQTYTPVGGYQYVFIDGVWRIVENPQVYATAEARNRIVNGAMQISQENGNTTVSADNSYPVDQWKIGYSGTGIISAQRIQVVTPNGSSNRVRVGVLTADTSIAATDHYEFFQHIEGIRIADFRWGTAQARQVILRFGFRGVAGTYTFRIGNSAGNRSYPVNFTISAAQAGTDTEQVFVIPGDITGTWLADTSAALIFMLGFVAGTNFQGTTNTWQAGNVFATAATTNNMSSSSNSFDIFDVGLYLDPNNTGRAPAWQMPDEADESIACQRYWYRQNTCTVFGTYATAVNYTTNMTFPFKQVMRINPAVATSNLTYGSASALTANAISTNASNFSITAATTGQFFCTFDYVANARM